VIALTTMMVAAITHAAVATVILLPLLLLLLGAELDRRSLTLGVRLVRAARYLLPKDEQALADEWEDDVRASGQEAGIGPLLSAIQFLLLAGPRIARARHSNRRRRFPWDRAAPYVDNAEAIFQEVDRQLAGPVRWMVPHGYTRQYTVRITVQRPAWWPKGRAPTFFARCATRWAKVQVGVELSLPAIWVPRDGFATEAVCTDNLDELRWLIEQALGRDKAVRGELVSWSPELPDGPRPGDLSWTVSAVFRWPGRRLQRLRD
jgi:hypothetical protein